MFCLSIWPTVLCDKNLLFLRIAAAQISHPSGTRNPLPANRFWCFLNLVYRHCSRSYSIKCGMYEKLKARTLRRARHKRSMWLQNMLRRCVLDDQWWRYSNYSCTRILVDGPPTRERVSGSLLVLLTLLTHEYPGEYGLKQLQTDFFQT